MHLKAIVQFQKKKSFYFTNFTMDMLIKMGSTRLKLGSTAFQPCVPGIVCENFCFEHKLSRFFSQNFYLNQAFFRIRLSFSPDLIKWCLYVSYMYEKLYMSANFWHQDVRVSHLQKNTRTRSKPNNMYPKTLKIGSNLDFF